MNLDSGHVTIVAEGAGNHNADIVTALGLIDAAANAGADVIKFQRRTLPDAIPVDQREKPKETPHGTMTYLEYRQWLELSETDYMDIDWHCRKQKLPWTVSVWDVDALAFMETNFPDRPFYKIPSAALTDDSLLQAAVEAEKPLVASTGMSTIGEIRRAGSILKKAHAPVVICHCTSTYPCPVEDLNLEVIRMLKGMFPWAIVGYSGHETGLATTVAAVALGAKYIERHITLDRSMWGSDQAASVEPAGFKRLVHDIRNVELAMGDGQKVVTPAEEEMKARLRRA